ncbi:hypothetical protein DFH08DRAFT_826358 [Mycena albidolilacea]|uniref:Uncharacterized protein n=1 Tax=Mycena albidolilacea TaxID=1033008 RepID=A0AAD6Z1E3_9AGAR|nr:hypothetical protein DFH08DRAFT_826358 [Mycena albidolilacea]
MAGEPNLKVVHLRLVLALPGAVLPEHVRDGMRVGVQNDMMNVDIETDKVGSGTRGPSEDGCVVPCSPDDMDLPPGPLTKPELEHAVCDEDWAQSARFGHQLEVQFRIAQGDGKVYSPALLLVERPDDDASIAAPTPCALGEYSLEAVIRSAGTTGKAGSKDECGSTTGCIFNR